MTGPAPRAEKKSGCFGSFMGCLLAGVLLIAALGGAAYYFIPKLVEDADSKIVPWVQSKARVAIGKMALRPLLITITHADLSNAEKAEWKGFLEAKYKLASDSRDEALEREFLINAARDTAASYPGIHYALLAMADRDFSESSLTRHQIRMAKRLLSDTATGMQNGLYSDAEIEPLKRHLHAVLSGWRTDVTDEQGRTERNKNLRDFLRVLHELDLKESYAGDGRPRDMREEFLTQLNVLRHKVQDAQRTPEVPDWAKPAEK